jgi:5'-deoxynucleotidase YfbR-like HD superfamily hydrolase
MMAEIPMDRLERVRQVVDEVVRAQPDAGESRCGFVHLYGVAALCVALAIRRGLDSGLCAVAGMLHDIWSYKTGDPRDHAGYSAVEAERILTELGGFCQDEIAAVCDAIARHSDKEAVDGDLAELLKDADVFQHYLYNPEFPVRSPRRLATVMGELGLLPERRTLKKRGALRGIDTTVERDPDRV